MDDDPTTDRIFTTADAARIVGVPVASARRWLAGYSYAYKNATRTKPARIGTQAGEVDGVLLMSFLDLIEVQMAVNLRRRHITWPTIESAATELRRAWNSQTPFALQRFRTDSRRVFVELGKRSGDNHLLEVGNNQYVFEALIDQSLFDVLDFREDGTPWRLWPGGRDGQILVDPARAFGRPIIESLGVPVSTLVAAYAANDNDVARVARWFDVPEDAVRAALRYDATARRAA